MVASTVAAVRVQRNVSLDPEHEFWLIRKARVEGHGNVSRVLQRLVELEAIREDGQGWRERVRSEREGDR